MAVGEVTVDEKLEAWAVGTYGIDYQYENFTWEFKPAQGFFDSEIDETPFTVQAELVFRWLAPETTGIQPRDPHALVFYDAFPNGRRLRVARLRLDKDGLVSLIDGIRGE